MEDKLQYICRAWISVGLRFVCALPVVNSPLHHCPEWVHSHEPGKGYVLPDVKVVNANPPRTSDVIPISPYFWGVPQMHYGLKQLRIQRCIRPLVRSFARSIAPLTHSLAPPCLLHTACSALHASHCSLHSRTMLRSFVCSLTHSQTNRKMTDLMSQPSPGDTHWVLHWFYNIYGYCFTQCSKATL